MQEQADVVSGGEQVSDRQIELFRKLLGHASRVGSVKQLVETMKNLIAI